MSVFRNFLIALDQVLNTLIRLGGEYGYPDETLSARSWRLRATHPNYSKWIDRLFFWQDQHCKQSYERETNRMHLPPEYRR